MDLGVEGSNPSSHPSKRTSSMNSAALDLALIASPVTPLSPAQVGGAQAVVADLAQGLATRGHRVTLCCAAGSEVPGVELVQVEVPEEAARSALVQPGGPASPRVASVDAAITTMFETIARRGCDVIGQHAFDAVAFEVSPDRPVLHTLHLPPLVPAVVEAAGRLDSNLLISVSEASRVDWAGAGIQVGRVIRNGISSQPATGAAVRRQALAAGRLSTE